MRIARTALEARALKLGVRAALVATLIGALGGCVYYPTYGYGYGNGGYGYGGYYAPAPVYGSVVIGGGGCCWGGGWHGGHWH